MAQLKEEYGDRVNFRSYDRLEERGKADEYDIGAVPTFVFLGSDGKMAFKVVGYQSFEIMRDKVETLLASRS